MFDAQLYRDKAEIEEWRSHGPIISLTTRLKAAGLMTEDDFQRARARGDAEVQRRSTSPRQAQWEPVEDLTRHVLRGGELSP